MNELLQKHGCANVFSIPEGLKELMADITREVLRDQPPKIFDYIANYLSVLLITREHGILAVKILDDLCDCRPSVSEHLLQLGMQRKEAAMLSEIIKEEVEDFEPAEGKEKVKETQIMKKVLARMTLDEAMAASVCQVARNAYRDYWYRKKMLENELKAQPNEPWQIAAERTLELYKRTKPSYSELTRATEKIQAAYRGYHVRRNLLRHLKQKKKHPKVELPGPPVDIADSREIDLGPVINLQVPVEDTTVMFHEALTEKLNIDYDPMKTITHVDTEAAAEKDLDHDAEAKEVETALEKALEDTPGPQTESRPSRADIPLPGQRKSRMDAEARPSLASGGQPGLPEASLQRISFAQAPVEFIDEPAEAEIPEDITVTETEGDGAEADVSEVPEDITDELAEGDDSAPTASVPSSAPDTADSTDVEDAEDVPED